MTISNNPRFPLGLSLRFLDPKQRLESIEKLGNSKVKAIELFEPTFDKNHIQKVRQILSIANIVHRTVHANFGHLVDISSVDPAIRSAGVKAVSAALDLAVQIDARTVIMHSSSEPVEDETRDERMKHAKHSIKIIMDMARETGCRVAIELLPRTCLGRTIEELFSLLEDINIKTAGVCLDTNHLMDRFASLPEIVRSLGPRLFALHCSDYDGIDEKHWPPLRGVINWTDFISALNDIGFSGPLLYEANLDGETTMEKLAFLDTNYSQLIKSVTQHD